MRDRREGRGAWARVALLALLAFAGACSRGVIVEQDGEGGILSTGGGGWSEYWHGDAVVGQLWTKGGITLCRTRRDVVARIVSVRPAKVVGELRVVAIKVRTAFRLPADQTFEDYDPLRHLFNGPGPGPPNARDPAGYVVPTACRGPKMKLGEILVTMELTGPGGGWIEGLEVTYRWEGRLHRFVIPKTLGLCGDAIVGGRCGPGPSLLSPSYSPQP